MNVEKRRIKILKILQENSESIPAKKLAENFSVTRQVIVKDIGILKAEGHPIISTNRGYILEDRKNFERIVKVNHDKERIGEELNLLVDLGLVIKDVFIVHKAYGKIKRNLSIRSRNGVRIFLKDLENDSPLLRLTSGVHYHTLIGESKKDLDMAYERLLEKGFIEK